MAIAALLRPKEPQVASDEWNIDTLRVHVENILAERKVQQEQRFEAQEKAVQAALSAQEKAIVKAEIATEKRFECVEATTLILCVDLIWRPAGSLCVGDELIAFDEEAEPDSGRRGRRFRRAVVTANTLEVDDLLEVMTPRGAVRCNSKHLWLTRVQDKRVNWAWVRADELQHGDAVHHVLSPWEVDTSWESGWLAGMFDGEGCLMLDKNKRTQLSISQRESPTATRIEKALSDRVEFAGSHRFEPGTSSTPRNTCAFYHFIITRLPEVMTLLGSVRPPRLLAKAHTAWDRKPLGGWHRSTLVTGVQKVGRGQIAALSTSSKTYIAAGFAMHNSVNEFRQQLSDQTNTFLPKAEFNRAHDALVEKIAILYTFKDTTSGLIGKIDALTVQQEQSKGKSAGVNLVWVVTVGATSLVINFAAIATFLLKGPPSPSAVATDKRIDEVLSRLIAIQQQVDTNTARIITNTAKK